MSTSSPHDPPRRLRAGRYLLPALALTAFLAGSAQASAPGTSVVVDQPTGFADPLRGAGNYSDLAAGGGAVSLDGRYVVFESTADGMSDRDADGFENVYRKDRATGSIELVTVAADGGPANGDSHGARISDDGNRVVFVSDATNLHAGASTPGERVFVRDIAQGRTIVASRGDGSQGAVVEGHDADISGDGRTVAFVTAAALDVKDGNSLNDVYARRLATDATILVSRKDGRDGAVGPSQSEQPSVSGDGLRIAFATTNKLEDADGNGNWDVYRRLIDAGVTVGQTDLVSGRDTDGKAGDNLSDEPSISSTGAIVAFRSYANDLDADAQEPADQASDVFIWVNGQQTLLSGSVLGDRSGPSSLPVVADGGDLLVAFQTEISGPPGDYPSTTQVFARNLTDGSLSVLSPGRGGRPFADGQSLTVSLSGDAAVAAVVTDVEGLGPNVGGDFADIVARDLDSGAVSLVSAPPSGPLAEDVSALEITPAETALTPDARYAVFSASHDGLGITDRLAHVFRRDLRTGETVQVDRDADGRPAGAGWGATMSADGQRIAFVSDRPLVAEDDNGLPDIYLRDLAAGTTRLVSRTAAGTAPKASSEMPAISADGRRVAFTSGATDLDAAVKDDNGYDDVYVRDLAAGTTALVSGSSAAGDGASVDPSISADGARIAFSSTAIDLDPDDKDLYLDVYVRDVGAASPRLISRRTDGTKFQHNSSTPSISADGRRVAFQTDAPLDTAADFDVELDVYVRDVAAGTTALVSRADGAGGAKGDGRSRRPVISADGTAVAFRTSATNLGGPARSAVLRQLDTDRTSAAGSGRPIALSGDASCLLATSNTDPAVRSSVDFDRLLLRALTDACEVTTAAPAGPGGQPDAGGDGSSGGGGSSAAPVLSDLVLRPATFRAGAARTPRAARARSGTVVQFRLDRAARVTLRIRTRSGRARGTLVRQGSAGANRIRFSGRIGKKALAPGRYRLVARAVDPQGRRSAPKRASFRVVR